jgi:hypothetical protein
LRLRKSIAVIPGIEGCNPTNCKLLPVLRARTTQGLGEIGIEPRLVTKSWQHDVPAGFRMICARRASLDLYRNAIGFTALMLGRICRILDACVLNGSLKPSEAPEPQTFNRRRSEPRPRCRAGALSWCEPAGIGVVWRNDMPPATWSFRIYARNVTPDFSSISAAPFHETKSR